MGVGDHCGAGKSTFFYENRGFRSEGLQKSENAVLVPPWRMVILRIIACNLHAMW